MSRRSWCFLAPAIAMILATPGASAYAQGYSPLTQINRRNVHRLQLVAEPPPPPQLQVDPGDSDDAASDGTSVFSMSPAGILWEHDRRTGAYRAAYDLGYQNMLTLDPLTGAVTQRSQAVSRGSTRPLSCPGPQGFKSRRAMAFHPTTHALFVPLTLHCNEDGHDQFHPSWPEGLGEFVAIDVRTGRMLWRHRTRAAMTSGALTTGGGVAVVGDSDGNVYIHDVANGKILYRTQLPGAVDGFPTTYAVRGRQYLALSTITGSVQVFALPEGTQ